MPLELERNRLIAMLAKRRLDRALAKDPFAPPASTPLDDAIALRSATCDKCDGTIGPGHPCPYKKCTACRRRNYVARPTAICPAMNPHWLPLHTHAHEPLQLAWVISSRNEGAAIAETVASLKAGLLDKNITLSIYVYDDASDDGSCSTLQAHVVRNDVPRGVGANFNHGALAALTHGADVVGFSDAHMRFPAGTVAHIAREAVRKPAIVTAYSRTKELTSTTVMRACRLIPGKAIPVAVEWHEADKGKGDYYQPTEAPLGSCYAMSRETIDILSAPSSLLWDSCIGLWGFLCEAMGMKARLMGIPVVVSRKWYSRHAYKPNGTNPIGDSRKEQVRNAIYALASLLHPETFDRHCAAWAMRQTIISPEETSGLIWQARQDASQPWDIEAEEMLFEEIRLRGIIEGAPTEGG